MTDTDKLIERLLDRLGSVTSPVMQGDNISILLCGVFDDPDQEEDEHGWTPAAIAGCDEVLEAIREHFRPLIRDLLAELTQTQAKAEKLRDAAKLAEPILEAELHEAIEAGDADWEGMARTAHDAITQALRSAK